MEMIEDCVRELCCVSECAMSLPDTQRDTAYRVGKIGSVEMLVSRKKCMVHAAIPSFWDWPWKLLIYPQICPHGGNKIVTDYMLKIYYETINGSQPCSRNYKQASQVSG